MTDKEQMPRYDGMDYEELVAAAQFLWLENAKLKERVEWLDGECRKSMGASHKFFEMVGEYQKENAKLRKLVYDMLRWMPCPTHCYHCERYHYPEGCEFEIRRRKLGIEVES